MTTMRKTLMFSMVTLLALAAAAPAFADDKGGDKAQFPMPAAQFKQRVEQRQAKMKEHFEKNISSLPKDTQKEARARMDAKVAAVNAEVAKAIADGTVTKDEAAAVRAAGGGHGGHCGAKKGEKKS